MEATSRPRWPLRRILALATLVGLVTAAFGASTVTYAATRDAFSSDAGRYNLAAWETRNVATKWLYGFGQLINGRPSTAEQDATLVRFFSLNHDIDRMESEISDARQRGVPADPRTGESLAAAIKERESITNRVEATIEGRLTQAIKDQGITRDFLFFHGIAWPPVDFAFGTSPRSLALSPRDHIQLKSTLLLRGDLSLSQVEQIEADAETRPNTSAIAFPTSGLSAYPPIVDYDDDYRSALTTIAHEWTHNYLFFRPLGFNYYASNDTRTMNETVANTVGEELAAAVIAKWPLPPAAAPQASAPAAQRPAVNVGAELRQLRGDVDALLADGKVAEAETLMEQKREDLDSRGVHIRKLNQAYFAFTNLYAGRTGNAGAVNPIGPKIDDLRKRSGSLRAFVKTVGGLTTAKGLDEALAKLPPAP